MKKVLSLASLLALAVTALASASTAKADYTIRVDNYMNPSAYANAKSANPLEVCVYTQAIDWRPYQWASEGWRCQTRTLNSISGTHDFNFVTGGHNDSLQITKVKFRINGSDLLIIDQWHIVDPSWGIESTFGAENEFGYCLSTDSNDFNDAHCWDGVNSFSLVWTLEPRVLVI